MKRIIKIISIILVICLIVSIMTSSAYAVGGQRGKAGLLAILQALNIFMYQLEGGVRTVTPDLIEYLWNPYTYTDWMDYADRSTIQINGNVIIDGEEYTDIWLSKDAADKFRTNALDIITDFNIASNSGATFAEGFGELDGIPVYRLSNGNIQSQYYIINSVGDYALGNVGINVAPAQYNPGYYRFQGTLSNGTSGSANSQFPGKVYALVTSKSGNVINGWTLYVVRPNNSQYSIVGANNLWIYDPFEFNYISENVNLDPIPMGQGLHIYVPQEDFPSAQIPDGQYPIQYPDPQTPGDPGTNVDISDLIADIIDQLFDDLNIEIDPETGIPILPIPVPTIGEPLPVPQPEPEGTISQTPWATLAEKLNRIIQLIQNIPQAISTIPSTIESIGQDIIDAIDSIGDIASDIADKIETGITDLFKDFIDGLRNVFAPILLRIKSALSIWHYVIEWLQSVGSVFTWIFGIASQTSYYIVLPIYASIAAAITIAIYKRFGR